MTTLILEFTSLGWFVNGLCDPSMELSSGHVAAAMENSTVSEVGQCGYVINRQEGIMWSLSTDVGQLLQGHLIPNLCMQILA